VTVNETGLLGVAVDPAFPDEPWVYAYYTGTDVMNHLVRIRAEGTAGPRSRPLLDLLPATAGWHNGGDLAFGPDGKLYVSVGDGHDGSRSQDPNGIGGRILRLNPDGSIPDDNPLGPGNPTFALGIRNSFGLCFDPETGELWETENGPTEWDEINLIGPATTTAGPSTSVPTAIRNSSRRSSPSRTRSSSPDVRARSPTAACSSGRAIPGTCTAWCSRLGGRRHTPVDEVVGMFDGGVTDVEQASDGSALGGHPDRALSANRPDRGRLPLAVREAR
jgi:hypothetical protein